MESVKNIHIDNTVIDRKNISLKRKLENTGSRSKILNKNRIFIYIISTNICLIIYLSISLVIGYTNSLGISSNNTLLLESNEKLAIEVNSLNEILSPLNSNNRIETIAKERLEMVYPGNNDIAKLEENTDEKLISLNDFTIDSNSLDNSNSIFTVITNIFR